MDDIYCNNCGLKGHVYKDCRNPIMSFGHILFRNDGNEPQILLIQRKDSLCYIEFLRGKYDIYNLKYIQILINKCSLDEKNNLLHLPFDKLWFNLWMEDESKNQHYLKNDYIKGKDKFEKLKKGICFHHKYINLKDIIQQSPTQYSMSEWEFPKGRKNSNETNKETAKREFEEETNYSTNDYQILQNVAALSEEYIGENRVKYKHIYYIGYLLNLDKKVTIDLENKDQFTEIKDIRWFTKEEALYIIRDYHHTRKTVIEKIFTLLSQLDSEFFIA